VNAQMRHRTDTGRTYSGATMHAAPGTHETALEVLRLTAPLGLNVLDVGAGSGAFSLRLRDAGWTPTALDAVVGTKLNGIRFIESDIAELSKVITPESVPVVVAVETIEHLQNPFKFLEDCYRILEPGGVLLITTPNILHPYSRIKFFAKGSYWLFDKISYWSTGHITPLPEWLLRLHLEHAGFTNILWGTGGSFDATGIRRIAIRLLGIGARRCSQLPSTGDGVILIMTARKPRAS
jgi:SAM-dependent methyltransferase